MCFKHSYVKLAYKNDYIELFGFKAFRIASGIMVPTLDIGDVIISKKVSEENIKKGDIITFLESEGNAYNVTHRIKEIIRENEKTLFEQKVTTIIQMMMN